MDTPESGTVEVASLPDWLQNLIQCHQTDNPYHLEALADDLRARAEKMHRDAEAASYYSAPGDWIRKLVLANASINERLRDLDERLLKLEAGTRNNA